MPIHSPKNQYRGVNAHVHSVLQNEPGRWVTFHSSHIGHLCDAIDAALPPNYYASTELSLQIREVDKSETGHEEHKTREVRPDVAVYQRETATSASPTKPTSAKPTATLLIPDTFPHTEDDYLRAVVIYRASAGEGIPVTHIELLSPGNKPGRGGFDQYLAKREDTLRSGLRLLEIDYLHQTRPIIQGIPSYPDQETGAYPYTIIVSDPRPSFEEGKTLTYGFNVDDPIPIIDIPLDGDDVLTFDFGVPYNTTFERRRGLYNKVDYEQLPERFETYSNLDQERIRARMNAVAETAK